MFRIVSAVAFALSPVLSPTIAQDSAPSLTAKQAETVDGLIDAGLEDDIAWELLESLTTEIGPRLGGSEAEARAREWGVARLKSLGFRNVRIETFEMPYWSRISDSAEIVSPFSQPLTVTALGQSIATPPEGVSGEIARFETLPELVAAPLEGFEGKIIFVDEMMARTQDGSGYGVAVAKRTLAGAEAGKRGAVAALIRSAGTSGNRFAHTGKGVRGLGESAVPIAALANADADQVARALERADEPVVIRLKISVETRSATMSGNVIGEIPGKTDEIILVGGHLDSWDLGTGAVDDGVGVAITAAAAKLVGDLPGRPQRTIRVIMWGAEEVGLLGANAYAEKYADDLENHAVASESDFGAGRVYRFDTRFGEENLPKGAVMAGALRRLSIAPGHNQAFGGPDVTPLRARGVPVVSLSQSGWDYFDLHHTADDTIDKIDPEAVRQNVAAWAAFIYMASEMEGDFR